MRPAVSARPPPSHLTVASLTFIAVAIGFGVIQLAWLEELRRPSVVLLGSGAALSLLVTDGDARLLIAAGDDPAAFGNALGRLLRPSQDRLDLVLVVGTGDELRAATVAAAHPGVRAVAAIAPFPRSPDRPGLLNTDVIETPRRFDLGSLMVTLETAPLGDEGAARAWRATFERDAVRIVVVSDGSALERFHPIEPGAVLVTATSDPMAAWEVNRTPALAFPDAAIPPVSLREAAAAGEPVPERVVRVFPGEAVPLVFVEDGVAIPAEATTALGSAEPSPNAAPAN